MAKRLGWTFLIAGALGMIAQIIHNLWETYCTSPDLILSRTLGSDTLISMGILGAILGGLGFYRHLEARTSFGAGLPFSGFAFALGQSMISPWTKPAEQGREGLLRCISHGLWIIIWFNVLVFALSFFIADVYYFGLGIHDSSKFFLIQPLTAPVTGNLLYLTSFVCCGLIACLWEIVLVVTGLPMIAVLALSWCSGALLAPTGIMSWLASWGGWGIEVTVMNGGAMLYDIAFMFLNGAPGAVFEFVVLVATLGCLFLTGLLTFVIHTVKYGHLPQSATIEERILARGIRLKRLFSFVGPRQEWLQQGNA